MTHSPFDDPFDDPDSTEEERDAYRAWAQCEGCGVARGIPHQEGCGGGYHEEMFGDGEARRRPDHPGDWDPETGLCRHPSHG